MTVVAWRIFKPKHEATAFTGEGARLYGGRWNGKGTSVVYVASSQSLAALELLVHLDSSQLLGTYRMAAIEFEESLVEQFSTLHLPHGWNSYPAPPETQRIGDQWVAEARSAMLRVPSVLVPDEHNYLINPSHPDFRLVRIGKSSAFQFDSRLIK